MNNRVFILFAFLAGSLCATAQEKAGPPENPAFEEKKWEELSNHDVGKYGRQALDIDADKWRHAETPNYIIHFRRVTEARKVLRELEYNVWYVAGVLGAGPEKYERKGHAYVFEDEGEWKKFLVDSDLPEWSGSLAVGDELFLNVRSSGPTGRFDSYTLAHEATHAVVARLYPQRRWPLWLNEGFAEAMASQGVASRKNQTLRRHQQRLNFADLKPEELEAMSAYPENELQRAQLYQSAEHFVRFLLATFPKEKFPEFVESVLSGKSMVNSAIAVFPDQVSTPEEFQKLLERFSR